MHEYDALFKKQGGVCAICKLPPDKNRRLAVDHDHKTGRIRGLLHTGCNIGLGCFKDSTKLLRAAILYLR